MVLKQSILDHMDEGYKKMESMLQESDNKCERILARMERKLDIALEEIKSLINGVTLQYNQIRSQLTNQKEGTHKESILGKMMEIQDSPSFNLDIFVNRVVIFC